MSRAGLVLVLAFGVVGAAAGMSIAGSPGSEDRGFLEALAVPSPASTRDAPEAAGSLVPQTQEVDGPPYNGQFAYVRVRYGESASDLRNLGNPYSSRRGRGGGREPPWAHDWPRAEVNFAKILNATTFIDNDMTGNAGRILTLDDPELFKYPIATIIEVGYWRPSDSEVANLRAYLLKGGFLIVDDTREDRGGEFNNLQVQMRRALPEYQIQLVPPDHEIYDCFFRIEDPQTLVPPYGRHTPVYLGIFEDNDPLNGRLMVMINFNTDLQEYWEFSDRGYYPMDLSNEAYQFGINYLIYAFTH